MSRIDETIQAKKDKRAALEARGINPHPHFFDKKNTIAEARVSEGKTVQTAGRLMAKREHGKVVFGDLKDSTGRIQIMLRQEELGDEQFEILSLVDVGDFIGVSGEVTISRTGELTIVTSSFTFLGKALRPLPTEWNAAEDKEARFRKRYLDMLINDDVKKVLDARWLIEKEIRRYLQDEHSFTEVETPVFQPLYGGTNAKPFTTHMNALDCDFYLRLAPELYLKRLVVGGYEKIFEIARNFRNEGIDQTHQPEFTMIEWYEAYADYNRMMDVAEGLIRHVVTKVHGSTTLQVGEHTVDIGNEWQRITMIEALQTYVNIDFNSMSDDDIQTVMQENKIELIGEYNRGKAQFALFDKLVTGQLIDPIWILDYPREVSPLSKAHRVNPKLAERFEGYIGGKEITDGWSEIVDAVDQRNIFEGEQKNMRAGDSEAHPMDEDFLEAIEYGMPPLGGIGMGIDRLVMFITNTWSIKEVIAFPTLKPLQQIAQVKKEIPTQPNVSKREVDNTSLPPREQAQKLLAEYIENAALRHHCEMVATAMEGYAKKLGEDPELWYQAGLLHDLDWEKYPDEHPNKAVNEILTDYPEELKNAILAHAPGRTGKHPETIIEKYLYACDELSGFLHAYSLMRPEGFAGMSASKANKKLGDKSFAANVNRDDIKLGFELIGKEPIEHIGFLIELFQ
jgi:lysyl-tRNA synthetase, class II